MIRVIMAAGQFAPPRTTENVMLQVSEEVGEMARAVRRPERCDEPMESEAADAIIAIVDAVAVHGVSAEELEHCIYKKLEKWRESF